MGVSFPHTVNEERFRFNRCERTGSTDAVLKWRFVSEDVFVDLHMRWVELGFGLRIGARLSTHLMWADHWYLLASTLEQPKIMFEDLTLAMLSRRLFWKPNSIETISPVPDRFEGLAVEIPLPVEAKIKGNLKPLDGWSTLWGLQPAGLRSMAFHIPRDKQTEQLGVLLDDMGSTLASWTHRLAKAINAFWSEPSLRDKSLTMAERMER